MCAPMPRWLRKVARVSDAGWLALCGCFHCDSQRRMCMPSCVPGNTALPGLWSAPSNVWPATTVGLPGKPTINSVVGAQDTITLAVTQAADKTATSFALRVYDAAGTEAIIPEYSTPLLSVGTPDGSGKQTVVFGTDSTRLGGSYTFKVGWVFYRWVRLTNMNILQTPAWS